MVKRDNRHILVGIGFVVAAISIAGAVYFGIKLGSGGEVSRKEQPTAVIAREQPDQPPPVVATPKVIKPKVDDSAIYAAIQGVTYRKEYCEEGEGPSITFDHIGSDGVSSATVYDYNEEGHVTNVSYRITNGILTMRADSVEDTDGNSVQANPRLVKGTIKIIKDAEIQIGDSKFYSCGY